MAAKTLLSNLAPTVAGQRKIPVRAGTTGAITLTTGGPKTIDGQSLTAGMRCLVMNQGTSANNGIYVVNNDSAVPWPRAFDADSAQALARAEVYVEAGTTNAATYWRTAFASTDTLGSTSMAWTKFWPLGVDPANGYQADVPDLKLTGTLTTGLVPIASRYKTSDQSITDSSVTNLTFPTNVVMTSITYSAGVFTVNRDGVYQVNGRVAWENITSPSGRRQMLLYINSTYVASDAIVGQNAAYQSNSISLAHRFTNGDTFDFRVYQNQGSAVLATGGREFTNMTAVRIGD